VESAATERVLKANANFGEDGGRDRWPRGKTRHYIGRYSYE